MQKLKIELTVIILICLTAVTASEVFEIFRRKAAGYNGWKEGTDSFTIPPSLCHVGESSSMKCARFNAKTRRYNFDPCHCFCSSENATFMFAKGQWKCTKTSDVHDLLGYAFLRYTLFYGQSKDNPLPLLDTGDETRIDVLSPPFVKNCRVDKGYSLYIGCDGVAVPFNSSQFTIKEYGRSDSDGGIQYYLKVNNGESSTNVVIGHIIKLSIRCDYSFLFTSTSRYYTRSLLFKYVGNVTCPKLQPSKQGLTITRQRHATLLPSTTLQMITASKYTKTGSLVASPVSTVTTFPTEIAPISAVLTTQSAFSDNSRNVSVTPTTTSVIQRTVVVPLPTKRSRDIQPSVFSSAVSAQPTAKSERTNGDDSLLPPSLMAVVIGTTAFVIVVIIVGSLVYRRRNLNKTPRASTICIDETKWDSVILSPQINSAYAADDQDLYRSLSIEEPPICGTYCKVRNHPSTAVILSNLDTRSGEADTAEEHYASLNNSDEQNIYGHGETQEPLYNVIEEPVSEEEILYEYYGPTVEEPVNDDVEPTYNVLEDPSVEGPEGSVNDDVEPTYNVLEDPSVEGPEGSVNDDAEPTYNVLEDPYIEHPEGFVNDDAEPTYNVLEDHYIELPEGSVNGDAELVYNVLEDPYIEVSEGSDHYGANSGQGPFPRNTLDRSSQDCTVGPNNDSQFINEPIYDVAKDDSCQTYQSPTAEDDFVTTDFVKNVLKKLELE